MAVTPTTPVPEDGLLSERFNHELSKLVERMYFDIRKGTSDLRPYERKIKRMAKRELESYGDRRELEGRVDEHKYLLTELVLSDATRPEELAAEFVQRSRDRYKYLESQKEKN